MRFSYGTQWPIYARQWDAMEALTENGRRPSSSSGLAIIEDKARYQGVGRYRRTVDDDCAIHQRE
jgi:hypothetical protein